MKSLSQTFAGSRSWQQLAAGIAIGAVAGGLILLGGESAIEGLYVLCFAAAAGSVAYFYPTLTVSAWAILSLHVREVFGRGSQLSLAGGVDALPTDPVLLGIAIALLVAFASGDERTRKTFFGPCLFWTLLVAWLFFQIFRSVPQHGIVSTLGEFRKTFQNLLILPYIIVFFRTKSQQRHLLQVLLLLSFLFILTAIVVKGTGHQFALSSKTRWMNSYSSLSLVWGAVALYIVHRHGLWKGGQGTYISLLLLTVALTIICNHRSVWLASAVVICSLVLYGQIPVSAAMKLSLGVLLAVLAIDLVYAEVDLFGFLKERLTAFTSFEEDQTANWRYQVWSSALQQSKAHWLEGKGLGSYFWLPLDNGQLAAVNLHNQYVQLVYQIGLVGLLLYLGHLARIFRYLWKAYRENPDIESSTMSLVAFILLIGGSAFYLAYTFDTFTWLYVGLGLAAAQTFIEQNASDERFFQPQNHNQNWRH